MKIRGWKASPQSDLTRTQGFPSVKKAWGKNLKKELKTKKYAVKDRFHLTLQSC